MIWKYFYNLKFKSKRNNIHVVVRIGTKLLYAMFQAWGYYNLSMQFWESVIEIYFLINTQFKHKSNEDFVCIFKVQISVIFNFIREILNKSKRFKF